MLQQLQNINPSARAPLFRRLMADPDLAYLREGKGIIGFELDLDAVQKLSGFALVGIQKHTIYAYRSDIGEEPRLVLFPPLDKLFDDTFQMLGLKVIKKFFLNPDFKGKELGRGQFSSLVKDLTPPEKEVDIPDGVSEKMVEQMRRIQDTKVRVDAASDRIGDIASVDENPPTEMYDEGPDDLNNFDTYEGFSEDGFDDYQDEPFEYVEPEEVDEVVREPEEDERSIRMKAQDFKTLAEVEEFAYMTCGVPKSTATQIVTRALQSDAVQQGQVSSIDLSVMLFCKIFNDKTL